MSWIALIDQEEGRFDPTGLGGQSVSHAQTLRQGTLLLELEGQHSEQAQEILRLNELSIAFDAAQNVILRIGRESICLAAPDSQRVRLSFHWDLDQQRAAIGLEQPQSGLTLREAPLPAAPAMSDVEAFVALQVRRRRSALRYVALSARTEAFGPYPTLLRQTRLETARGLVPVSDIRRGDLVRSDRGALVPVLHLVARRLPARGDFAPIRLYAPGFGLTEDLVVAANQNLILRGADIEYSFGCETVLMPARHLLSTPFARPASCGGVMTFYQLILPRNEGLMVGQTDGPMALASLNVGRIRRKPQALACSSLHGIDRNLLPEHPTAPFPVLTSAETLALMDLRAA